MDDTEEPGPTAEAEDWDSPWGTLIDTHVTVVTWNLWWQFGPWERRLPAIIETLRRLDPDVVLLQEVWDDGTANAAGIVADALGGHDWRHASRLRLGDDVAFGNAVVSRWPITRDEMRPLPADADRDELRTVLFAEIDGPRGPLQVFSTHCNWRFDHSDTRVDQVRAICEFVEETRPRTFPPIVGGDFNAAPDSDEIRQMTGRATPPVRGLVFHDAHEVAGTGPGTTWSNDNPFARVALEPDRRIDYVFAGWPKAGGAGHVVECEVIGTRPVDGMLPSDHFGVLARLRY